MEKNCLWTSSRCLVRRQLLQDRRFGSFGFVIFISIIYFLLFCYEAKELLIATGMSAGRGRFLESTLRCTLFLIIAAGTKHYCAVAVSVVWITPQRLLQIPWWGKYKRWGVGVDKRINILSFHAWCLSAQEISDIDDMPCDMGLLGFFVTWDFWDFLI